MFPMALGHVLLLRAVVVPLVVCAHVAGDPLAVVEALDGRRGETHVELLFDQSVRHAVIVAVGAHVIVQAHPCFDPFGIFVPLRVQRSRVGNRCVRGVAEHWIYDVMMSTGLLQAVHVAPVRPLVSVRYPVRRTTRAPHDGHMVSEALARLMLPA